MVQIGVPVAEGVGGRVPWSGSGADDGITANEKEWSEVLTSVRTAAKQAQDSAGAVAKMKDMIHSDGAIDAQKLAPLVVPQRSRSQVGAPEDPHAPQTTAAQAAAAQEELALKVHELERRNRELQVGVSPSAHLRRCVAVAPTAIFTARHRTDLPYLPWSPYMPYLPRLRCSPYLPQGGQSAAKRAEPPAERGAEGPGRFAGATK